MPPNPRSPSREKITADLRAWVKRHGPLSHEALHESDAELAFAMKREFGTASCAAKELKLPLKSPHPLKWTKDSILKALVERIRDGKSLAKKAVSVEDAGLFAAANRNWDTWEAVMAAVEAALRSGQSGEGAGDGGEGGPQ